MKKFACAILVAAVSGCTTPADVSQSTWSGNDKNAESEIHDTPVGFTIDVKYSRYQAIPEADALLQACRSVLTVRAYDEAKRRGREIVPINEQEIRVSTGRNILNGRTACRAFVEARWK